jgi:hypothetical protein
MMDEGDAGVDLAVGYGGSRVIDDVNLHTKCCDSWSLSLVSNRGFTNLRQASNSPTLASSTIFLFINYWVTTGIAHGPYTAFLPTFRSSISTGSSSSLSFAAL